MLRVGAVGGPDPLPRASRDARLSVDGVRLPARSLDEVRARVRATYRGLRGAALLASGVIITLQTAARRQVEHPPTLIPSTRQQYQMRFDFSSPMAPAEGAGRTPLAGHFTTLWSTPAGFLSGPGGLALDRRGNLYVAKGPSLSPGPDYSVGVYAIGPRGEPVLIRRITHPRPSLVPIGIAVDGRGNLHVTTFYGRSIVVFAPNADGAAAPIRAITGDGSTLERVTGLAVDAKRNVYAVNHSFYAGRVGYVTVYAPDDNVHMAPIRTIAGAKTGLSSPIGIAIDRHGAVYIANPGSGTISANDTVTVYAPGADGNVAPIRTIAGSQTGLDDPTGLTLDRQGFLYVTNQSAPSVTVYAPGADGEAAPIRTIMGPKTGLCVPIDIAVDNSGRVYVANYLSNSVTVYRQGASGDVPPLQTIHLGSQPDETRLGSPFRAVVCGARYALSRSSGPALHGRWAGPP